MLGRDFADTQIATTLPVKYPVCISKYSSVKKIAVNDTTNIDITIQNVSSKPYGGDSKHGQVEVMFVLDRELVPSDPTATIENDKNIVRVTIPETNGLNSFSFSIPFTISQKAKDYQTYHWSCYLLLRGKMIQFETFALVASPGFYSSFSDVLLVLHKNTSRDTYLNWRSVFATIPTFKNISIWDTEYHNGKHYIRSYEF